jgi:hypothetical protein
MSQDVSLLLTNSIMIYTREKNCKNESKQQQLSSKYKITHTAISQSKYMGEN